jgi:serine/threonine-protein kinase
MTGTLPYVGKTPRELFSQLLTQPPTPLNAARPGLRFAPAVEAVVMQALSKAPGDRFASVSAFAGALVEAVASSATAAPEAARAEAAAPAAPVPERAAPTPSRAKDPEPDKSGGLFGKMKGLFRR